jgi:hypothetical protein
MSAKRNAPKNVRAKPQPEARTQAWDVWWEESSHEWDDTRPTKPDRPSTLRRVSSDVLSTPPSEEEIAKMIFAALKSTRQG